MDVSMVLLCGDVTWCGVVTWCGDVATSRRR